VRLALAALLLGLACAPLHAQPMEKKKTEEKKKTPPFKAESTRSERERDRHREHKPPPPSAREQRGPMNVPPQKSPANKQFSAHPSETRPQPTAPSVAEQQQRKSGGTQQAVFQCSARPVCGGGGYGRCSGVQQTYRGGTEQSRRRDIVDDCIQANTPDTCQCAVQCRRLARCSMF
jgi:hypothetical protein